MGKVTQVFTFIHQITCPNAPYYECNVSNSEHVAYELQLSYIHAHIQLYGTCDSLEVFKHSTEQLIIESDW